MCSKLRQKLIEVRNLLLIKKSKIAKCKEVVKETTEKNKKEVENSVAEYYKSLTKAIAEFEKKAYAQLKAAYKTQLQTISYYNVLFGERQ